MMAKRTTALLGALLLMLSASPAAAATSEVGESVAAALAAVPGATLTVDDSAATACMGADAEPVAYGAATIVLRSSMTSLDASHEVRRALDHLGVAAGVAGVERIHLPAVETPLLVLTLEAEGQTSKALPIVALARTLRERGIEASPDYAFSPSGGPIGMWPNGYPVPTVEPPPERKEARLGDGVEILVYDTGLAHPTESDHPDNVDRLQNVDSETVDADGDGIADVFFAGHGVAIGGVLDTIVPDAEVEVARIVGSSGIPTDTSAARRMANSLRAADRIDDWPDLIVNAFGSPACDLDPTKPGADMAPLGLAAVAEAVDAHGEALVVAAAGNRSSERPFYPAAFPSVVAVGALDATGDGSAWTSASRSGPVASFSNLGAWVDLWAPGVALATNHLDGIAFETGGDVLAGLALVDGTSYAAPYVAGLLAEHMAAAGVGAEAALAELIASGEPVDQGVAVALTSLGATATTPAS